jgi:hypothetical protein
MKTNQISRYATALALASIAVLVSACGSNNNSSVVAAGIGVGGGGVSTPGACVLPLSQSLIFGAQGAEVSATEIYAAPNTGSGMITTLSGGGYSGGYQYSNSWNPNPSDIYVGMNIQAGGAVGYPTTGYPTTGGYSYAVQGALQLTSLRWQTLVLELEQKYPYGYTGTQYGYGTPPVPYGTAPGYAAGGIPANICISEIAFQVIYGPGTLQGGEILLYLNTGDQVPLVL